MTMGIKRISPLQKSIPAYLARPMGQIIAKWAYLEYRLSTIIWNIMGVDEKVGRLAVNDPRAKQKWETIRDLLFLRGHELNERKYKIAYDALEEISELRDLLAHGLWACPNGKWGVVKFGGKLEDQTLHKIERKRRIRPESFEATPQGMAPIIENIDNLITAIDSLDGIVASLDNARKLSVAKGRKSQSHKTSKRPPRRKSSPRSK